MKMKSIVLMAVALGCGLVAMFGVQQVMSGSKKSAEANTVKILMATVEIPAGTMLVEDQNVAFKDCPVSMVPEGAVKTPEQFKDRAVRFTTPAGVVVMAHTLGEPGVSGAALKIPKGMRVVTIPVDTTTSHSGQLMPGDHVDVLATYKVRHAEQGMINKTATILQCIKVFSSDNVREPGSAEGAEIKAKNISLLVTPEQANFLMLAKNKGTLQLALRAPGDEVLQDANPVVEDSLGNLKAGDLVEAEEEENPYEHPAAQPSQEAQPVEMPPAPVASWEMVIFTGDKREAWDYSDPVAQASTTEPASKKANGKESTLAKGPGAQKPTNEQKPAQSQPTEPAPVSTEKPASLEHQGEQPKLPTERELEPSDRKELDSLLKKFQSRK